MDDTDDTDDHTPVTPPQSPGFESWLNHDTLVSTINWPGPGEDRDDDRDDQNPPPQVPDWCDYPFRFRALVNDIATEWWLVSLDCVVLVAKRTITGFYSLDRLADGYLLTTSEVNSIIDTVLDERHEFIQLHPRMVPGYRRLNRPIRAPAPLGEHDMPFRNILVNDLPRSAYAFLVRSRWAAQTFIRSLTPDEIPWLFAPQAGDQSMMFDLHTAWNEDTGYPFWHDYSPSGQVLLFQNRTIRNFIIRTLIDSDSGIFLGNANFFFQSVRLRPIENVRTECDKISFILSWLIVEMRAFSCGQMHDSELRSNYIRQVALEQRVIYAFLDTILSLDSEMEQELMGWVSF